jgi:hypothetical protein
VAVKPGVADFTSRSTEANEAELIEIMTKGENKMTSYGETFKESQIEESVALVRR